MRFNYRDAEKFGGNGGTGFFSLKNDGDIARVRILYRDIEDVEGVACHEVEVNGKKRYVNCIREYNSPVDDCPFCKAGKFQVAKLYIPIEDLDTGDIKLWERGKKFFAKITSLCSRYPEVFKHTFEIERHGKPGDTSTTYEIYEVGEEKDLTWEDVPEVPNIIGGIILDKNADEMQYYLDYGAFPDDEDSQPVRRRGGDSSSTDRERRTPRGRGDAF